MQTFIINFFDCLGERFNSENNLSDLIWTICEINTDFKRFFLSFFFYDIDYEKPFCLCREVSVDNSRPDFMFEINNQQYLIEIKINDRKDHFDQYIKSFPDARRGYITNYPLVEQKRKYKNEYTIKTWQEMINLVESEYKNKDDSSSLVIKSFIIYLKKVCQYGEVKHMSLQNISSLAYFNNLVDKIVEEPFDDFELIRYKTRDQYAEQWSGSYFSLKKTNWEKPIYPWFGIHYHYKDVFICFDFEYKSDYCSILKGKKITEKEGKYFDKPEELADSGGLIRIRLKAEYFNSFDEKNLEQQKEILNQFFREVIREISHYL